MQEENFDSFEANYVVLANYTLQIIHKIFIIILKTLFLYGIIQGYPGSCLSVYTVRAK